MASWINMSPQGSKNRRKWNLEDRQSLNKLKYNLAVDGNPEMQFNLARQLLENKDSNNPSTHIEAVNWLLAAALEGHKEAIEMLTECYKNRQGITEQNEIDVQSCLAMSPTERSARKAAREMFLYLSNNGENITPAKLETRMRQIYNLQRKQKYRRKIPKSNENENIYNSDVNEFYNNEFNSFTINGERIITEANLVNAAINYSNGRLPQVNDMLSLSVPNPNLLNHFPTFRKLLFHPIIFFAILYHRFVKAVSSFPNSMPSSIQILIILLAYNIFTSGTLTILTPVVIYYLSLACMFWSTFKMLKSQHDFIDFRIWSGLFLKHDENVDANSSESLFLRNNMFPYLCFFLSFVVNLVVYPIINSEWLIHSETTVIAFILVILTLFEFMYTSGPFPDLAILFSFGVNVVAKYPYEMDNVFAIDWHLKDLKLPTFYSLVIGNGIEFYLSCRTILYFLIPGFLIYLAKRLNWHGTYYYLIPHCVTLCWLQICFVNTQASSTLGLVRATLGLAAIFLFLPFCGIITIMVSFFFIAESMGMTNSSVKISIFASIIAILSSCLLAIYMKTQKYVIYIQIIISVVVAVFLSVPLMKLYYHTQSGEKSLFESLFSPNIVEEEIKYSSNLLSWETFQKNCGQSAWEISNKIQTQLKCSQFDGVEVKWEGLVQQVEISRVYNFREMIIKEYLPDWLIDTFLCFFGEKNKIDCSSDSCDIIKKIIEKNGKCNLKKWNAYEYIIKVNMQSGLLSKPVEIYIIANNVFANFTENLMISDRIWFQGKLVDSYKKFNNQRKTMLLGSDNPTIYINSIGCLVCQNEKLAFLEMLEMDNKGIQAQIQQIIRGVKYLLNVLLNPLLTFK